MLPRDNQNFVKSFNYNQDKEILDFFDKYGVVVIRNILNQNEIESSINAIWNHDELTSRGVDRNNRETWERCWPKDGKIERKGWISSNDDLLCPISWRNRFNPFLLYVFKLIWKAKKGNNVKLRIKTDRYGVMRPLLNHSWKTDDGWLHTDQNPHDEKDFIRIQGILTFTDSTENSGGGFVCIPGFHHQWREYCKQNPIDEDVAPFLSKHDEREEKITARAGSLIIWDSRLPHANYPNLSQTQFRFVQYITYYPAEQDSEKRKRIRKEDAAIIINEMDKKGIKFTEEQKELIGY